jgi:hypothetical protein
MRPVKYAIILGLVAMLVWLEAGGGEGNGRCYLLGGDSGAAHATGSACGSTTHRIPGDG